ncbi:hypothetical protein R1sor_010589 [Riccia sorocarpa]|uniref:Reverse transcriptase domain-containing protein n=1 Tax=Riccia sorocarpa TaxID=122646 RepID=A0ABD3HYG4_9MARC
MLPGLVSGQQTGFVSGRNIFDNILALKLGEKWAVESNQPAIFLKLDFVKAYDRIRHAFLWETLSKMSFSDKVFRLIQGLMRDAAATVHHDGDFTEDFPVTRGMTQVYKCHAATKENFIAAKEIIESFERISETQLILLSWQNRIIVLKHALATMPVDILLMTLGLTTNGYKMLDMICWRFLWGLNKDGSYKKPLISWNRIYQDKDDGVLGLRTFKDQAQTLKMRLISKILDGSVCEWAHFARALLHTNFMKKKKHREKTRLAKEILLLEDVGRIQISKTLKNMLSGWCA